MQEGVGGALAQLHEAEALGHIEPLDHGLHVPVGDFVPVEIMVMRHHNGHSKTSEGAPLLRPAAIAMRRSPAAVLHPVRDLRTRYREKPLHRSAEHTSELQSLMRISYA